MQAPWLPELKVTGPSRQHDDGITWVFLCPVMMVRFETICRNNNLKPAAFLIFATFS